MYGNPNPCCRDGHDSPLMDRPGYPPLPPDHPGYMPPERSLPPRMRPPLMMDRDRPPLPPGGRRTPPGGWGPGGRGRSPPPLDHRSPPPPFDRRSPPPLFDRERRSPPPFDRRGPPPPHDRRSPPPMFRGPVMDRRGPPPPLGPPGYRSPDLGGGYRRSPPHGRPYPTNQTPPPEFRKGEASPFVSLPGDLKPRHFHIPLNSIIRTHFPHGNPGNAWLYSYIFSKPRNV